MNDYIGMVKFNVNLNVLKENTILPTVKCCMYVYYKTMCISHCYYFLMLNIFTDLEVHKP